MICDGDVVRNKSTKKDDVGEQSSDWLKGDDASGSQV